MKKYILKIFILLSMLILTIPTVSAKGFYKPYTSTQTMTVEDFFQDKKFVDEAENYLKNRYGENYKELFIRNAKSVEIADKIKSLFSIDNKGEVIYPNYVGGLYINDKDQIIIQIVASNIPNLETKEYSLYKDIISLDKETSIEYVKYSYEVLENVNEKLTTFYSKNQKINNVIGFYVDVKTNKVIVELNDYTQLAITKFKETVVDSPIITFVKGIENVDYANLIPGTQISNLYCSYGYRTMLNGQFGIVTAAHCFSGNYANITGFGEVQRWNKSGRVDAAWIKTNSNHIPSNSINVPYGTVKQLSTRVITSFTVGQRLAKIGYVSGFTSGSVVTVNYTSTGLSGQVLTNFFGNQGDSGGIVFEYPVSQIGSPTVYGFRVAGIVHAGPSGGGNFNFTRADYTNSLWGLSRY